MFFKSLVQIHFWAFFSFHINRTKPMECPMTSASETKRPKLGEIRLKTVIILQVVHIRTVKGKK